MARTCTGIIVALSLVVAGLLASPASANVSAHVYLSDEQTPLPLTDPNIPDVYCDIMVGTRLTIFITSDTSGSWGGQLWLSNESLANGYVTGRGYNSQGPLLSYEGSRLEAAGKNSLVFRSHDPNGLYFTLISSRDAVAGEWFVLDYEATGSGPCCVGLYASSVSGNPEDEPRDYPGEPPPFPADLLEVLCFNHVLSRDFDGDTIVNFVDFAIFANEWRKVGVEDPNMPAALDLNTDDRIDARDMALFSEYWLERSQAAGPSPDPNVSNVMP